MLNELTREISTLQSKAGQARLHCQVWRGQARELEGQQQHNQSALEEARAKGDVLGKAQVVLQRLEDTWRGRYEAALAALGSQGLNAVFTAGEYEVLLESNVKRGVSNLDIVLVKDGQRVRLKGGSGGSVVQVLAYLLRHLMTTSHRPELRHLEALDEPFSQVAAEQRPALCTLVKEITQRLGFQLLLTSHEDEMLDAADVAYLIHPGGHVERLKSPAEERV